MIEVHIVTHVISSCPICGGPMRVEKTKLELQYGRRTRYAYCKKPDCKGSGKSIEILEKK
jgi:hypothetical protein